MASYTHHPLFLSLDDIKPNRRLGPYQRLSGSVMGGKDSKNARLSLGCNLGGSRTPKIYWDHTIVISAIFMVLVMSFWLLRSFWPGWTGPLPLLKVLRSRAQGECLLRRLCLDVFAQIEKGLSCTVGDGEIWWEVGSDKKGERTENC